MNIPKIKSALWLASLAMVSQGTLALDSKNVDLAAKQIQVALNKLKQGQTEGAQEHMTAAQSHLEVARREASDTAAYDLGQQKLAEGLNLLKTSRSKEAAVAAQKALDGVKAIR